MLLNNKKGRTLSHILKITLKHGEKSHSILFLNSDLKINDFFFYPFLYFPKYPQRAFITIIVRKIKSL